MNKKIQGVVLVEFVLFVMSSLIYWLVDKVWNVYIILGVANLVVIGAFVSMLTLIRGLDLIFDKP